MTKYKRKNIEEILSKVSPEQKQVAQKLRSTVKIAVPDAIEAVRQGKIAYSIEGKDFAWITTAESHVDLEFMCGTRLSSERLKGRGQGLERRHIEIKTVDAVNEAEIIELLKKATELTC
ncbi:DUF1801 domain-containing protein [Candidatus Bathyarchaeota archaeon A05DMB-2]|jgi:hypothetical protein|nr:DUF1801 domain-containing protein [Candidatus Bathyarchaeota archaeon A05DMB-2]